MTETVVAEGLISASNPHALYQVVYHHYRQMLKAARGNVLASILPVEYKEEFDDGRVHGRRHKFRVG